MVIKYLEFLKRNKETIVDIIVLILIILFLFSYFKPSLLFSLTTTTGGDMGSHYYPAKYMVDYLLPQGKIIGWTMDWYAGMPMFQFYFPLPYLLISFFSLFIPFMISFKIGTLVGIFALPICVFFMFRFMGFRFPTPAIGAISSLIFLFLESNSMYGGNIPSTLAGEFAQSISLALLILYFGLLYRGIQKKKHIIINAILLSLIVLSHLFVGIIATLGSLFFLINRRGKENLWYLARVFILGFVLIGFWTVPFLAKLEYTTSYNWNQVHDIKELFPKTLVLFYIIATVGVTWLYKLNQIKFLLFSIFLSFLLFWFIPDGSIWNVRFLPIIYLFMVLISAITISEFTKKFKMNFLVVLIILLVTFLYINSSVKFIPSWIEWNYSGYESKNTYKTFLSINEFLKELPQGRVLHEYSDSHNKFGSPRVFETIPVFAEKPVITGAFVDSSVTSLFHFILQPEFSDKPSCPIRGINCPKVNIERGLEHLKMFNVKYLIATSNEVKKAIKQNKNFHFLKKFEDIEIYEIENPGYVSVLNYEPEFDSSKNWKKKSLNWFEKGNLDKHLVFVKNPGKFPANNKEIDTSCIIQESISNEEILFNTSCVGKPHLISVSYYPNWKVDGADNIYLISPSFMMIYPTKSNVRIYYGKTVWDIIGYILTLIGLFILLFYLFFRRKLSVFSKKFDYSATEEKHKTTNFIYKKIKNKHQM